MADSTDLVQLEASGPGPVPAAGQIQNLPNAAALTGSEIVPVVQGGQLVGTPASAVAYAFGNQTRNLVLAGPTSGSAAPATFRALVAADIPLPSLTTIGGVKAIAPATHQFLTSIGTDGTPTLAQPAASDLSNGTTGSGAVVLATGATLATPILGVASATSINKLAITAPATSATLTIADGKTLTVSNTLTFTGTDNSSVAFGAGGTVLYANQTISLTGDVTGSGSTSIATTVAKIAGTAITGTTGSGNVALSTSPSLTTPILGTPQSGTLTNCTGLPIGGVSGLGTGVATFLATPSSANLSAALTDKTGTGVNVFANTPTLITPVLGVASATSINFGGTALAAYNEGTWTPVDSSGASLVFTSVAGHYVRIGSLVIASFTLTYPATADVNTATIGGLPFTSQAYTGGEQAGFLGYSTSASTLTLFVNLSATTFNIYTVGGAAKTNANMSTFTMRGTVVYRTP